ncbi:MAG TPA: hypothetical protein VGY53_06820 [Isosphaeraceae bacterium]|nr:hypothetical protein [Isosphaeraceae bacterium]
MIEGPETTQTAARIVPPRPNPGPEPMPDYRAWLVAALLFAIAALLAGYWLRVRRRKRRLRRKRQPASQIGAAAAAAGAILDSQPRDPLILRAEAIRNALVARFGPAWAAKTTEEIAAQEELAGLLEPDQQMGLKGILSAADRAKFGNNAQQRDQRDAEALETLSGALLAALAGDAGATSSNSGR